MGKAGQPSPTIVADVAVDGLDRDARHMWLHEDGLAALDPLSSTCDLHFQAAIAPGGIRTWAS